MHEPTKATRKATRWRAPDEPCLNCGDPTPGRFCPSCGQRKTDVLVSVRTLLADVLEDQLVLNRALPRTLGALLFHPGRLTAEYVNGRIVRYIAPFRLYLVASVIFFLLLSFFGLQAVDRATLRTTGVASDLSGADSALQAMRIRQEVLADLDTTDMPAALRAALRQSVAQLDSARATLPDSGALAQRGADVQRAADTPLPPGVMQPWAREISIQSPFPVLNHAVERRVAEIGHLPPRMAVREVLEDYVEYAPHMVFLLLPLFALLLKLLYARRGRYYAEHFVFALHVHAFAFVIFIVMFALPWDGVDALLLLWAVVYLWLAMKRVYGQGVLKTTLKWWVLGWSYLWVFSFGMVALAFVTLLLT